jgi:hypothetical protein
MRAVLANLNTFFFFQLRPGSRLCQDEETAFDQKPKSSARIALPAPSWTATGIPHF